MADVIQTKFDELEQIAKRFGNQSDNTTQTLQSITRVMDKLQSGDWIGRGSDAFFAEMTQEVLPALQRLIDALAQSSQVTREIGEIIAQADEEASAPFRSGDGGGSLGPGTNGSRVTTGGESAVERFARLASGVYPADPPPNGGSGSWSNGQFHGDPLRTNQWDALLNGRGFSGPNIPGFNTSGLNPFGSNSFASDGWGSGASGWSGRENDYGIPRDWLSGVTGNGNYSLHETLGSSYNDYGIPRDWLSGVIDAFGANDRRDFGIPRDWLSGVMAGFQQDLEGGTAAEEVGASGSGGSGSSGGGSESGGSSGGGSGSGPSAEPMSEPTTQETPTESASPTGGGGGGMAPQSQVTAPTGTGSFDRGYGQTTVTAADDPPPAAPRLRYQPLASSGGVAVAQTDPPLARVAPSAPGVTMGGTPAVPAADNGLRNLSLGLAAVSPLLALAGKLIKSKFSDNNS